MKPLNSISNKLFTAEETRNLARPLIEAAAAFDGQKAVSDQALLEAEAKERTVLGFFDGDNLAGVGVFGKGEIDLVVHPDLRGQKIGSAAFATLLTMAETENPKVWVHGEQPAAERILEQNGFARVRTLLRLERPGDLSHETAAGKTPLPEGFSAHTLNPENETELADLLQVNSAAFADHPEQGALDFAGLKNIMSEDWFDPEDVILVREAETSQPAAFGWVKTITYAGDATTTQNGPAKRLETELYVIGVHPDFAGQGIGSAVMSLVFARMAKHDPMRITLYVEGDNTRALRLYEKTGFNVAATSKQWIKQTP